MTGLLSAIDHGHESVDFVGEDGATIGAGSEGGEDFARAVRREGLVAQDRALTRGRPSRVERTADFDLVNADLWDEPVALDFLAGTDDAGGGTHRGWER